MAVFKIIEDCIVYSDKDRKKLQHEMAALNAGDNAETVLQRANKASERHDEEEFWDFLDGVEKTFRRIRAELVVEHGNAIPIEDFVERSREVFNGHICERKFVADDLDVERAQNVAKRMEKDGLNWTQAAWKLLAEGIPNFSLKSSEPCNELKGIPLSLTPQKGPEFKER